MVARGDQDIFAAHRGGAMSFHSLHFFSNLNPREL